MILLSERDKAGNYKDILNLFDLSHFNIQPDDENENSVVVSFTFIFLSNKIYFFAFCLIYSTNIKIY